MKRIIDIIFSILGLLLVSPFILFISFLIWNDDKSKPLYIAERIGFKGKVFKIIKLRTMIINADRSGVDSTSSNDPRITNIGHFIRKFKLDELTQFFNILNGEMSFVGPRPNVRRDVNLYTNIEKRLLSVKPGITDFSSVIFSDEAEILKGKIDPDISYNQLIRPWKSRLGLFYIDNRNIIIDFLLILITGINIFSRKLALFFITNLLKYMNAPNNLIKISKRKNVLQPFPPPGSDNIIKSRVL
tara:strand:- start:2271 stop:3002 length:732 start_codon:yes stop_codon:yes gene_type:complete